MSEENSPLSLPDIPPKKALTGPVLLSEDSAKELTRLAANILSQFDNM
ncbi:MULTISPECIES: hypothetical protein [Photorhabdus]|nr:hypothetical protein [Photorhabdus khanii]